MQPQVPGTSRRPNRLAQTSRWMALLWIVQIFAYSIAAHAQTPIPAASLTGGSIAGLVKSGNTPIPGATVTASNTLTGQKVTTWTNVAGQYSLHVPANGRYVVKAQMPAFAVITGEALINAANSTQHVDLEIVLASRSQVPADAGTSASNATQRASTGSGRGYQSLSVLNGEGAGLAASSGSDSAGSLDTPLAGVSANIATPSVSVAGNATAADFQNGFGGGFDDRREFNAGGQPGGPGGGGGFRGFGGGFGWGFGRDCHAVLSGRQKWMRQVCGSISA